MKKNMLGSFLAAVTGGILLICLFVRAFLPRAILPRLDLPAVVLLCLLALLLDFYLAKASKRNYLQLLLYGALVFGLLPLAASFTAPLLAIRLALMGGLVFPVVTFLFDITVGRLNGSFLAPIYCAMGLYLAAQAFMGIF